MQWDERIQSADFDLYLRSKKRAVETQDIKPIHLALGVYFHHYSRLTFKSRHYIPFADADNLISLDEKWGPEKDALLHDINH